MAAIISLKCAITVVVILVIKITTVTGGTNLNTFNVTCDPGQYNECQNNTTLVGIAASVKKLQSQDHIQININLMIPVVHLNDTVRFSNLNFLSIVGKFGTTDILCPSSNSVTDAGIILSNITGTIILKNFKMSYCGSRDETRLRIDDNTLATFTSALTIVRSRNVEMSQVVIANSRGIGLTVLEHQGGKVEVVSAIFLKNKLPEKYEERGKIGFRGGGVYIAIVERHKSGLYFQTDKSFIFEDCKFLNNNGRAGTDTNYRLAHTHRYDQGGGAYISLKHDSLENIRVSFLRCQFAGNQAYYAGGGLSLSISAQGESSKHNAKVLFEVVDSTFEHNGCDEHTYTQRGGALQLTILDESYTRQSIFSVNNATFTSNCAEIGGAIHYRSHQATPSSNAMRFDGCMFKNNTAHIGSAVAMTPDHSKKLLTGYKTNPVFQNCFIQNNFVCKKRFRFYNAQRNIGTGTVYASLYNVHFEGTNVFQNNMGSGLYIVNGIVNTTSSGLRFINNTGINGGAMALIGASRIILGQKYSYEFINNTAFHRGGAIYVLVTDHIDFTASGNCFIHIDQNTDEAESDFSHRMMNKWNANVSFSGNKALHSSGGHAIYATSLYPCLTMRAEDNTKQSDYMSVNVSHAFTIHGVKLDSDVTLQPQVATDGAWLRQTQGSLRIAIPGEKFHHGVIAMDDLGQPADASFLANFNSKSGSIKLNPANFTYIGDSMHVTGEPGSNANLYIHPVSPRHNYVKVEVKLHHCPPGFKLTSYSECACNAHAQFGLFKCDDNHFQSYLLLGYWAGYIGELQLLTSECPFCDFSDSLSSTSEFELALPKHFSELDEQVCGKTRTGIVCGVCRENYTVHFHSPAFLCKPSEPLGCKLGWFFYVISELAPVTAVFILVFVFNISFTSGAVNGFILFSQLLGSLDIYAGGITVFSVTEKPKFDNATQGYRVLYGFFNLDFFNAETLSFCLWKNASALDMLAFKYVTILYTLLLVVAVICIMNKCGGRCLAKYYRITTVKVTVIHGISTFLVVCYAQCIRISLSLLLPVHLHTAQNEKSIDHRSRVRVWFNGELTHLGKDHWLYAAPAIFCLLTVGLLPPLLLLVYPLMNKSLALFGLEEKKPFQVLLLSINWLKPLLDSFQGCFKDNLRFFAGLYFLYRWTFLLFHWGTGNFSAYYTGIGGILVFMLTLHTVCQPYIKRVHNVIDTLLFANLVLINSLSFFNYHKTRSQRVQYSATVSAAIVQQILIYLPLMVIGFYFLLLLCQQIFKCAIHHSRCSQFLDTRPRVMKLISIVRLNDHLTDSHKDEFVFDRISDEDVEYEQYEEREQAIDQ